MIYQKKCVPCEGGIPPFNYDEIHKYLKKVDGWEVKKNDQDNYFLTKEFKFKDLKTVKILLTKLVIFLKMKTIIPILILDGVTQK